MTLWLVRAGKNGEREALALEKDVAVIGWEQLPDLSKPATRDELTALLAWTYPNEKPKTLSNWESQVWPFARVIVEGDLVVLPLKTRSTIAIGRVTGPYQYRSGLTSDGSLHTRPVKWLGEFPRSAFDQDLLYSLGAFMTVCRIQRNKAEERVNAIIAGKSIKPTLQDAPRDKETSAEDAIPDIEQYASDQIRNFIARRFKGHALSKLVAAILTAEGYHVQISPEGPDGGVDIIAGKGALGFDAPRLAVQVKSSESPIDVKILRELQGSMKSFGADQGLIVTWGGYGRAVAKEASRLFFQIRLWDSGDLVRMIQTHYDAISDDIQADLPLQRIWTLVPSDE
ncbi:restriction endonuclease [Labrys sp. LIt4]|uniref:restriction endonuclease n=1 Tax=Labrys sp. LIt4 TaxID=2821355 RepID=UPI001ADEEDC8|nr:restriction endonuclease [Labrys sp. LIt4]MBP0579583.1 restriction endonuclease [Labrys sp. LIt4]